MVARTTTSVAEMTELNVPVRVPAFRYTSQAFAQLEQERMWPFVWAVACTVDHVSSPW